MHHHYLLNKPHSYLSQFTNQHTTRRNKKMLGELHDFAPGTMSVGRLDENSEGLLLLTTDGKVSYAIAGAKKVEKEYYAQVLGEVTPEAIAQLNAGVEIGFNGKRYQTLPCTSRLLDPAPEFSFPPRRVHSPSHGPTSWISITLREGKYRQVRKMAAAVGHPVIRLIRVRIGKIELGSLAAGEVVEVDKLNFR
ncbi:pseudouridine synthase [Neolewinella aurantiaca]|uniref:Pseudouridine synthase n=1 Tax=Neolewinella aurantiaca TaxID=2602767 RepID=A0A5C7FKX9_9BACT|nr:pseudouridine synthase [Neolewinella aurantiaca]TXF90613.1 pseudouridine synthase [Neolewinella aurantiaca]